MRWKLEHIFKKSGGILLEDDAVIALNKPSGVLVLPDRFDKELHNLYDLLKETFGSIYVVHRIDRETSGIILFAKTAEAHAQLNQAFEHRTVGKVYHAIVLGDLQNDTGSIDLPISENDHGIRKMKIDTKNGKDARTEYSVLERFDGYTYVEARPQTGRTHQIRVHLSSIGYPIISDPLYSPSAGFFLSNIKKKYKSNGDEQPLLARTALHARSLSFLHPVSGLQTKIEAPLPRDMEAVLKALRKYRGN